MSGMSMTDDDLLARVAEIEGWPRVNQGWEWSYGVLAEPLTNDAQAMALVRRHRIGLTFTRAGSMTAWTNAQFPTLPRSFMHGTHAGEPDDDYRRNCNRAVLLAIVETYK